MRFCGLLTAIVALAAVTGCSRGESVACVTDPRYSGARSSQPVQIPDDLSPPSESDAIRLPPDTGAVASLAAGECIEEPPPFFGDTRPFVTNAETEAQSRRERRAARRAAEAQAPAGQAVGAPTEPTPAPAPSEPAPAGDDRVIDN